MADVFVPTAGFEPATFGSGDQRSNPLSYVGIFQGVKVIQSPC